MQPQATTTILSPAATGGGVSGIFQFGVAGVIQFFRVSAA